LREEDFNFRSVNETVYGRSEIALEDAEGGGIVYWSGDKGSKKKKRRGDRKVARSVTSILLGLEAELSREQRREPE